MVSPQREAIIKDPNLQRIVTILQTQCYDLTTLIQTSPTRYKVAAPIPTTSTPACCNCKEHVIVQTKHAVLQNCDCSVQILAHVDENEEVIYEANHNQYHHRYSSHQARHIRVPENCKFVGLKSNTGTGKTHQIDILLRALIQGQYDDDHTDNEKRELDIMRQKLGPSPSCMFMGPRVLLNLETVRKFSHHGTKLSKVSTMTQSKPIRGTVCGKVTDKLHPILL